jgi:hypothetical protein
LNLSTPDGFIFSELQANGRVVCGKVHPTVKNEGLCEGISAFLILIIYNKLLRSRQLLTCRGEKCPRWHKKMKLCS